MVWLYLKEDIFIPLFGSHHSVDGSISRISEFEGGASFNQAAGVHKEGAWR